MTVSNFKELQKLIRLCRKLGISTMKVDNLEFTLGSIPKVPQALISPEDMFPEALIPVPQYTPTNGAEDATIETEELTDEQLMFYSARPEVPDEAKQ